VANLIAPEAAEGIAPIKIGKRRCGAATDGFTARYALARCVIDKALRARRRPARDRTHNLAKAVQAVGRRPRRLRPRAGDGGTGLHRALKPGKAIALGLRVRPLHRCDAAHLPQQIHPTRIGIAIRAGRRTRARGGGRRGHLTLGVETRRVGRGGGSKVTRT
jgi:hypothetical protein